VAQLSRRRRHGDRPQGKTTYADLIGGRYFNHKVEWNKQTGNPMTSAYRRSQGARRVQGGGKPFAAPRRGLESLRTDEFITDVRVRGMLHARVIRRPAPRARCGSIDESSIKATAARR